MGHNDLGMSQNGPLYNMIITVRIVWENGEVTTEKVDSEGYKEYIEEIEKKNELKSFRVYING